MYDDQDEHLNFLKEKISSIKIALFKSEFNSELQLPNNIIQTLKVDDDGSVWFFTSCNGDHASHIDRTFYAYLDYYRKGTGCRLQIGGKANIVDNGGLFSMNDDKGSYAKLVLVRLKIMQAEFFENKMEAPSTTSWTDKIKTAFHHLFLSNSHRIYHFSK